MSPEDYLKLLDGFAGFAALVNGIILWPVVKGLKAEQLELRKLVMRIFKRSPKTKTAARKRK